MGNMSSAWSYLPELVLVGAAFLGLLVMVGRETRPRPTSTGDSPPDGVRYGVIALLLVASVAHVPVIPEHLDEAPYMGVLFIAFTLTAFAVAAALAMDGSRVWYLVTIVVCTAAVGAYIATRVVAFPELADDVGAWTESLGLVSITAEASAVMLSATAVRRTRNATRPWRASEAPMRHR